VAPRRPGHMYRVRDPTIQPDSRHGTQPAAGELRRVLTPVIGAGTWERKEGK